MNTGFVMSASDQMLVAAAKGRGDRMALIREAWGKRVGLPPELVPMGAVVRRLAEIVEGCQVTRLPNLLAAAERMMMNAPEDSPHPSPFVEVWFWVLVNAIQVAPRSVFVEVESICEA